MDACLAIGGVFPEDLEEATEMAGAEIGRSNYEFSSGGKNREQDFFDKR